MTYAVIESEKGPIARAEWAEGEGVRTFREFFELLMEAPAPTLFVEKSRITDEFFELRSGLAGEVLQKVSNYRRRLIIEGDFTRVESRSLKDFIRESNRTGQVVFCENLAAGVALLK